MPAEDATGNRTGDFAGDLRRELRENEVLS
jgi:hypothetical protein